MEENHNPTSPIADESALMSLRAMLVQACNEAPLENEALLEQVLIYVDTLLGLEEPTEDANEGLTHEDFQHDEEMPADYWDGELKAEADAERQADAAYELAAELASCDWEGWD